MENINYGMGATESPKDDRTFTYAPTKSNKKGGERWLPKYIDHQHKVGICTGISKTMRGGNNYNKKFSAEFQYLCQKKFFDLNWEEGSSIFYAIKVAKNIGLLPVEEWTWTTEEDRNLPYSEYIKKLQAIPDSEIDRLKLIAANYKVKAYASVPIDRDSLANAIDDSDALLVRFSVGNEWFTAPIEPLRPPVNPISGHAVNLTNYDGNSFRIANSWGTDWADEGTAYFLFNSYKPTEAWAVWFEDVPEEIQKQIDLKAIKDLCDDAIGKINQIKVAIQ